MLACDLHEEQTCLTSNTNKHLSSKISYKQNNMRTIQQDKLLQVTDFQTLAKLYIETNYCSCNVFLNCRSFSTDFNWSQVSIIAAQQQLKKYVSLGKTYQARKLKHEAPFTLESYCTQKCCGPFLPLGHQCIHSDLSFSR